VRAMRELIDKCVEEAANPAPAMPTASVQVHQLADVVADLSRPAVLVVEDGINERTFILALASAFGRRRVVDAVDRGWLRLAHAGGKSRMAQFVAAERQHFRVLVRVAAVLDSDRRQPGEPPPANARQFAEIAAIDGVTVHMWRWREVENYLPSPVWSHHYPARYDAIQQLSAMIPGQRGFIDTKQIIGKPKPLIPHQLRLTEDDFAELGPDAVQELRTVISMIDAIL